MTNHYNNVLYIGVTNDVVRRVAEHKAKINKGFTYKYNCDKLVYYETFSLMTDAIAREKQLKNWKREWKNELVIGFNVEWRDLSKEIGIDDDYINAIKEHYEGIAGQARNDEEQGRNDEGGEVARNARQELELKTGKPAISSLNVKSGIMIGKFESKKNNVVI
jgi:putative endonuclease